MNVAQLEARMTRWLQGEYEAVLFEEEGSAAGYALFRRKPEFIELRQFFVIPQRRRQSVGRAALAWLWAHAWSGAPALRVDVLVGNAVGRAFWQSVGFQEYCVTMEARSAH